MSTLTNLTLQQVRCQIFNTIFNPTHQRLGNKILRQRLKGEKLAEYYPPRISVMRELRKAYPDWGVIDEDEDYRVHSLQLKKERGKGTPKKRTAAESKKLNKRRPGGLT